MSARVRHSTTTPGHPIARWVAIAIAALVGYVGIYSTATVTLAFDEINTVDNTFLLGPPEERPAAPLPPTDGSSGSAYNILLIGSDVRTSKNSAIGGGSDIAGMRGDTTMLVHISADRRRIDVLSIPRDLEVRVADCLLSDGTKVRGWTGKFNIAFANGGREGSASDGAACVQKTVEDMTGIYTHAYAVVDFYGFIGMIDALGGVPMCIDHDIDSPKAQFKISAGAHVLTGRQALGYARARTGTGTGDGTDLARIERQHELIGAVFQLVLSKNILSNVDQLTEFVRAGAQSMTMSPELGDPANVAGLAFSLRNIDRANIKFYTTPWYYLGNGNVGLKSSAQTMFQNIIKDVPLDGTTAPDASIVPTAQNRDDRPATEDLIADPCGNL